MSRKICTKCGEDKENNKINYRLLSSGSYRADCYICERASSKLRNEKNKEKKAEQMKQWKIENADYVKAYNKGYYDGNGGRLNYANKSQKEKDKINARRRASHVPRPEKKHFTFIMDSKGFHDFRECDTKREAQREAKRISKLYMKEGFYNNNEMGVCHTNEAITPDELEKFQSGEIVIEFNQIVLS